MPTFKNVESFRLGIDPMPDWFIEARNVNKVITYATGRESTNPFKSRLSHALIEGLDGVRIADRGDYVVKDNKGDMYPCKPDMFTTACEPMEVQ